MILYKDITRPYKDVLLPYQLEYKVNGQMFDILKEKENYCVCFCILCDINYCCYFMPQRI